LLKIVTSNRFVEGKNVELTLTLPFSLVANRFENVNGVPYRDRPRTMDRLVAKLWEWFKANPAPTFDRLYAQDLGAPQSLDHFSARIR